MNIEGTSSDSSDFVLSGSPSTGLGKEGFIEDDQSENIRSDEQSDDGSYAKLDIDSLRRLNRAMSKPNLQSALMRSTSWRASTVSIGTAEGDLLIDASERTALEADLLFMQNRAEAAEALIVQLEGKLESRKSMVVDEPEPSSEVSQHLHAETKSMLEEAEGRVSSLEIERDSLSQEIGALKMRAEKKEGLLRQVMERQAKKFQGEIDAREVALSELRGGQSDVAGKLEAKLKAAVTEKEDLKRSYTLATEEAAEIRSAMEQLQSELADKALHAERAEKSAKDHDYSEQLQALRDELDAEKEKHRVTLSKLSDAEADALAKGGDISQLRATLKEIEDDMAGTLRENDELREGFDRASTGLELSVSELEQCQKALTTSNQRRADMERVLHETTGLLQEATLRAEEAELQSAKLEDEAQSLRQTLDLKEAEAEERNHEMETQALAHKKDLDAAASKTSTAVGKALQHGDAVVQKAASMQTKVLEQETEILRLKGIIAVSQGGDEKLSHESEISKLRTSLRKAVDRNDVLTQEIGTTHEACREMSTLLQRNSKKMQALMTASAEGLRGLNLLRTACGSIRKEHVEMTAAMRSKVKTLKVAARYVNQLVQQGSPQASDGDQQAEKDLSKFSGMLSNGFGMLYRLLSKLHGMANGEDGYSGPLQIHAYKLRQGLPLHEGFESTGSYAVSTIGKLKALLDAITAMMMDQQKFSGGSGIKGGASGKALAAAFLERDKAVHLLGKQRTELISARSRIRLLELSALKGVGAGSSGASGPEHLTTPGPTKSASKRVAHSPSENSLVYLMNESKAANAEASDLRDRIHALEARRSGSETSLGLGSQSPTLERGVSGQAREDGRAAARSPGDDKLHWARLVRDLASDALTRSGDVAETKIVVQPREEPRKMSAGESRDVEILRTQVVALKSRNKALTALLEKHMGQRGVGAETAEEGDASKPPKATTGSAATKQASRRKDADALADQVLRLERRISESESDQDKGLMGLSQLQRHLDQPLTPVTSEGSLAGKPEEDGAAGESEPVAAASAEAGQLEAQSLKVADLGAPATSFDGKAETGKSIEYIQTELAECQSRIADLEEALAHSKEETAQVKASSAQETEVAQKRATDLERQIAELQEAAKAAELAVSDAKKEAEETQDSSISKDAALVNAEKLLDQARQESAERQQHSVRLGRLHAEAGAELAGLREHLHEIGASALADAKAHHDKEAVLLDELRTAQDLTAVLRERLSRAEDSVVGKGGNIKEADAEKFSYAVGELHKLRASLRVLELKNFELEADSVDLRLSVSELELRPGHISARLGRLGADTAERTAADAAAVGGATAKTTAEMDKFRAVIDKWAESSQKRPKKQTNARAAKAGRKKCGKDVATGGDDSNVADNLRAELLVARAKKYRQHCMKVESQLVGVSRELSENQRQLQYVKTKLDQQNQSAAALPSASSPRSARRLQMKAKTVSRNMSRSPSAVRRRAAAGAGRSAAAADRDEELKALRAEKQDLLGLLFMPRETVGTQCSADVVVDAGLQVSPDTATVSSQTRFVGEEKITQTLETGEGLNLAAVQLKALRAKNLELGNNSVSLKSVLDNAKTRVVELEAEIQDRGKESSHVQEQARVATEKVHQLLEELKIAINRLSEAESAIQEYKAQVDYRDDELRDVGRSFERERQRAIHLQKQVTALKAELDNSKDQSPKALISGIQMAVRCINLIFNDEEDIMIEGSIKPAKTLLRGRDVSAAAFSALHQLERTLISANVSMVLKNVRVLDLQKRVKDLEGVADEIEAEANRDAAEAAMLSADVGGVASDMDDMFSSRRRSRRRSNRGTGRVDERSVRVMAREQVDEMDEEMISDLGSDEDTQSDESEPPDDDAEDWRPDAVE